MSEFTVAKKPAGGLRVYGRVLSADGVPQVGKSVIAYRRSIMKSLTTALVEQVDTELGDATTSADGSYVIVLLKTDEDVVDALIVKATDANAESPVLFNVSGSRQIDLITNGDPYRGRTEFAQVAAAVDTHAPDCTPRALDANAMKIVAGKAAMLPERIAHLHAADKIADESLDSDILYALFRHGMPTSVRLLGKNPDAHRAAIETAASRGVIEPKTEAEITAAVDALREQLKGAMLSPATAIGLDRGGSLRTILDATDIAEEDYDGIVSTYLSSPGVASFWTTLRGSNPDAADTLEHALKIAALAGNRPWLYGHLLTLDKSVEELAAWTHAEWVTAIGYAPAPVDGGLSSSDKDAYAEEMLAVLDDAMPTVVIGHRLDGINAGLHSYLTTTPSFDLRTSVVADREDAEAVRDDLAALQRAFRVAPSTKRIQEMHAEAETATPTVAERFDCIQALIDKGYQSATSIASAGRAVFKKKLSAIDQAGIVDEMYDRASFVTSSALAVATRYHPRFRGAPLPVMRQDADAPSEFKSHDYLFGSASYCGCEECASVLSPAAYLADLLHFLSRRTASDAPAESETTMLDVLTSATVGDAVRIRREDLRRILLDCDNTNIAVPFIDLVNEILEFDVVTGEVPEPPATPTAPASETYARKTTGDAATRAWLPEHETPEAYTIVGSSDKVFPWTLPFDRWLDEERACLSRLDVNRADFVRVLHFDNDADVRAERLGLSPAEFDVIFPTSGFTAVAEQWGLSGEAWVTDATRLDTFLRCTGLTIESVRELSQSRYINPAIETPLDIAWGEDPCDIESAYVVLRTGPTTGATPDADLLGRIFRFVRLQRGCGWSFHELEAAIAARSGTLDAHFLAAIVEIHEKLDRPVLDVVAWLNPSAMTVAWNGSSHYADIFGDPSAPVVEAVGEFVEGPQASRIAAALGISGAELIDAAGGTESMSVSQDNLRELFRRTSFAKAIRISVAELERREAATSMSFGDGTDQLLAFVEAVRGDSAFGLSIGDVDYFVNDGQRVADRLDLPSDASVTTVLRALVQARHAIGETPIEVASTSVTTDRLIADLTTLFATPSVDDAIDPLVAEAIARIDEVEGWNDEQRGWFVTNFSRVFGDDIAEAKANLGTIASPDPGAWIDVTARRAYVLSYLSPYASLLRTAIATVGPIVSSDPVVAHHLLARLSRGEAGSPTQVAIDRILQGLTGVTSLGDAAVPMRTDAPEAFAAVDVVVRCGRLIEKFGLLSEEYPMILEHRVDAWFDPAHEWGGDAPAYAELAALRDAIVCRRALLGETGTYFDLVALAADDAPPSSDYLAMVVARTGWSARDIEPLVGSDLYPSAFGSGIAFTAFRSALEVVRPTGLTFADARDRYTATDETAARDRCLAVKSALSAKYSRDAWPSVAKSIADGSREARRDALVAYLVHRDGLESADELFGRLLIDTQTAPNVMTSRIKAAIGSVQTFIQRGMLELEPGAHFEAEDHDEWQWLKSYRVWEANRRVFLYPENWLDPALRDNKTPAFEAFEKAIRQNESNADLVDEAFHDYGVALAHVAQLEVAGHTVDPRNGTLHVIARTRSEPREYFYRRRSDTEGWTGWEKFELSVSGEQITPVVYQGRLYVFWMTFSREGSETEQRKGQPIKYTWTATLNWSYRDGDKWRAVRSFEKKGLPPDQISDGRKPFCRTRVDGSDLCVELWSSVSKEALFFQSPQYLEVGEYRIADGVGSVEFTKTQAVAHTQSLILPRGTVARGIGAHHANGVDLWLPSESGLGIDEGKALAALPYGPAYDVVAAPQSLHYTGDRPAFFQDRRHTYFVEPVTAPDDDAIRVGLSTADAIAVQHVDSVKDVFGVLSSVGPHDSAQGNFGLQVFDTTAVEPSIVDMATDAGLPVLFMPLLTIAVGSPGASSSSNGYSLPTSLDVGGVVDTVVESLDTSHPVWPHRMRISYRFTNFEHPLANVVLEGLERGGAASILAPSDTSDPLYLQQGRSSNGFIGYAPTSIVLEPRPRDQFELDSTSPYAEYNWELFFHLPFLIADRLRINRQFEDAFRWIRYIFDPKDVTGSDPAASWRFRRFREEATSTPIDQLMRLLDYVGTDAEKLQAREELEHQVRVMRASPFHPHAIARLRPEAYQKATVMKMLDILIEWGDSLFEQDTIEKINEATQLYILAALILGRRPLEVDHDDDVQPQCYAQLPLDEFSNALVPFESIIRMPDGAVSSTGGSGSDAHPLLGPSLYFCVPANETLLSYWDTVADRLFKIRHSQSLQGVTRVLPLFEPPIDPALLIRAAAAGVSVQSALADLSAPRPLYRFSALLQKASEMASEVRAFGGAMLSAMEKRDAEHLAALRTKHEVDLLELVHTVKQQQVEEAKYAIDALNASKSVTNARAEYYEGLVEGGLSAGEVAQLVAMQIAFDLQTGASVISTVGGLLAAVPDFSLGVMAIAPHALAKWGGENLAKTMEFVGGSLQLGASLANHLGTVAGMGASYQRRADEWAFQGQNARLEIAQIDKQLVAAEIRLAIAQNELANHETQMKQSAVVDTFMRAKFTNEELYDWMASELSRTHQAAFRLAMSLAKKAQRAYQIELGTGDPGFIRFDYWEDARKGLLAGERLAFDLKRMEAAYLDANVREHEMVKHVSLAQLDPVALVKLKTTGMCSVSIPEVVYDLDQPGHYFRRIKSVALTMPCVAGPYASVNCKLTLSSSKYRKSTAIPAEHPEGDFETVTGLAQSIVTSSAQGDSGLFETNLRDERYLPFEGAGAISTWNLELPTEFAQFDHGSITDVVMTIRYTARFGGETFAGTARDALAAQLNAVTAPETSGEGVMQMIRVREQFPDAWHAFLHQPAASNNTLSFDLQDEVFPLSMRGKTKTITNIQLVMLLDDEAAGGDVPFTLDPHGGSAISPTPGLEVGTFGNAIAAAADVGFDFSPGEWSMTVPYAATPAALRVSSSSSALKPSAIRDLVIVLHYTATTPTP